MVNRFIQNSKPNSLSRYEHLHSKNCKKINMKRIEKCVKKKKSTKTDKRH